MVFAYPCTDKEWLDRQMQPSKNISNDTNKFTDILCCGIFDIISTFELCE